MHLSPTLTKFFAAEMAYTVCLKKTEPLQLRSRNFINSQRLLVIFGRIKPYSILN